MTAQSVITINDGQATPVAKNFQPRGAKSVNGKDVAVWRDQSALNSLGFLTLTETHTPTNPVTKMEKFRYVLTVPTTEVPYGATAPALAFYEQVAIEFFLHERSTAQGLQNLTALAKNLLAHTYVQAAVQNRDAAW